MWSSFIPDIIVALMSAVFTVLIAFGTYILDRRRREVDALNALIEDLHFRRALSTLPDPARIRNAESFHDYSRANLSVISMRHEMRSARDLVRGDRSDRETLAAMVRACNRYLENSTADPGAYAIELSQLRKVLSTEVRHLSERRGVTYREPGSGAFEAPGSE